ncbi:MAG: glycosyl hydrolase [Kiritimatiellae bacterium]|nr:glycosyl hydrolase [Kiritimatiellia bacterium]
MITALRFRRSRACWRGWPTRGCAAGPAAAVHPADRGLDLSDQLRQEGGLEWEVPPGSRTVLWFGRTLTGQTTRPAPEPGVGWETDKFSRPPLEPHFTNFPRPLLEMRERRPRGVGLTTLHFR